MPTQFFQYVPTAHMLYITDEQQNKFAHELKKTLPWVGFEPTTLDLAVQRLYRKAIAISLNKIIVN